MFLIRYRTANHRQGHTTYLDSSRTTRTTTSAWLAHHEWGEAACRLGGSYRKGCLNGVREGYTKVDILRPQHVGPLQTELRGVRQIGEVRIGGSPNATSPAKPQSGGGRSSRMW